MMKERIVHIMRGLPGSGKSTFVARNFPAAHVCSADDFFMAPAKWTPDTDGPQTEPQLVYQFNPSKIGEAHNACLTKYIQALGKEMTSVVVDNTNVHYWEYQHYVLLAQQHGYQCVIHELRPHTLDEVRLWAAACIHGVPPEIVARMAFEWEPTVGASPVEVHGREVYWVHLKSDTDYSTFFPWNNRDHG